MGQIDSKDLGLLSDIYNVSLNPDSMESVLDRFSGIINAEIAATTIYGSSNVMLAENLIVSNLGDDLTKKLEQNIPDQHHSPFKGLFVNPERKFVTDMNMLGLKTIEEYAQRPVMKWVKSEFNVFHGAASCMNINKAWVDILFVMFSADRGPITKDELHTANFFLDHFAKSVEVSRAFNLLQSRFSGVLTALDKFHIGVFVLSPSGSVVCKNNEAERIVSMGDGLSLAPNGMLRPADHVQRALLNDGIKKAVLTANAEDNCAETILTIQRSSSIDPYLVEVSPINDSKEIDSDFSGALVYVIDPDNTEMISTEGMKALYSLTNSESHVCRLLADGFTTDEIADERNLTQETVRKYIKQIMQKTRTNSRAQLVRLALNVNLPIEPVEEKKQLINE